MKKIAGFLGIGCCLLALTACSGAHTGGADSAADTVAGTDRTAVSERTGESENTALADTLCCMSVDDEEDDTLYFVDVKTGTVSHCTLTNASLGWKLDIVADAGSAVLVVYDYDAQYIGDGYDINTYSYGLIDKEDLYNSIGNYRTIALTGEDRI